ncbi:MAG TPA: C40 family peptidase [Albitalea sp.]|nr:C40 family peptidase [Albitalea sp.]
MHRASHPRQPLRAAALLAALGLAAGAALGAPDMAVRPSADPVARLLSDRGLLDALPAVPLPTSAGAAQLAQQVRDRASDMVLTALTFLGVPYKRGGASETAGFDCSGFTRHIVETSLGLVLPRRADEQAKAAGLMPVKKDDLQPGDLVFFNTLKRTFSHVGIYIGEGKFIHAPRPGGEVRVEEMGISYWRKRFTGARRVDGLAQAPSAVAAASAPTVAPAPAP